MKVLFVCVGNTCRSPFAEGLARRLAAERGLEVEFASAGEHAIDGDPCPPDAVAAAADYGVDLAGHRATRLTSEQRAAADEVVPLFDVPDPVGRGIAVYRQTYAVMRDRVAEVVARLDGAG
jgi:protein-tyrosine-phosphatase